MTHIPFTHSFITVSRIEDSPNQSFLVTCRTIFMYNLAFYAHVLQSSTPILNTFLRTLESVLYIYFFLLIICTNGWSIPTIINVSPTLPTYMIHKCYAAGNCFTLMLDGHSSTTEMASTYSELSMAAH